MRHTILILSIFLIAFQPVCRSAGRLHAQTAVSDDPYSFIGLRLNEIFERFGLPSAVFSVRGHEQWQDDVVFRYREGDFYIFRDRVWQIRLSSVSGISIGDPKQAALLVLGNAAEDMDDYILATITGRNWPLMLRLNINNAGIISDIYIYRADY